MLCYILVNDHCTYAPSNTSSLKECLFEQTWCCEKTIVSFLFPCTSFLPLFFRRVQGTKRTNQEQRLYTQRSVKTRLSIVRVVSLSLVCSFCPLYTSEEKGKKTSSRKQNVSLRLRPASCVLLSLLAFLSQRHLFKHCVLC